MKYLTLISFLFFIWSCTPEEPPAKNTFVVEAFIFTGEPIDDIKIKSIIPLDQTELISDPINDASVTLIKNNIRYGLVSADNEGNYEYPAGDLNVEIGDLFQIEVVYDGITATGETMVPEAPQGVSISEALIELPPLGPGFVEFVQQIDLIVSWDNPSDELHFMVIEDRVDVKDPIFPEQVENQLAQFRLVSEPTRESQFEITVPNFTTFGEYVVKVYRINQEYADLYQTLVQDSRDLNEPLSNITNALGVFSAFTSDSVFFEVRRR